MKNYEKKHYFIVSAITLVVLSPLIIWLFPYILQRILYDNTSIWLIETPGITYSYFAIACLILIVGSLGAYFFSRFKIVVCIGCVILAFSFMFIGSKHVMTLGTNGMAIVEFQEEKHYSWEELEMVYLIINEETKEQSLEFHFKDNEIVLIEKGIENIRIQLLKLKNIYGFPFTMKE